MTVRLPVATLCLVALWLAPVRPAAAQSPAATALARARQAYNAAQFDVAIGTATEARRTAATAAPAALVLGRAHLERFRLSGDPADLAAAHGALAGLDPARLSSVDRHDLTIGLGLAVFFEGRPGVAAELLESALGGVAPSGAGLAGRERLFDWWATAMDRAAQLAPDAVRASIYARVLDRAATELAASGSAAAAYWVAAGARGAGDLERAWHAAVAAWIRAKGASAEAARGDLDQLVITAIIPERARALAHAGGLGARDAAALDAAMRAEWAEIRKSW